MNKVFDPDEMPKWLASFFDRGNYENVIVGINEDDCAVLKVGSTDIIISTDYLNANPIATEFGLGNYRHLGKLLVAANFSDLCGTGAKPIGFLCSIMLDKKKANNQDFKLLMKGIKEQLNVYGVPLVGGDTKLGNSTNLCGIAIGRKEKGSKLFFKNSAVIGDSIWVSSEIGNVSAAVAGLRERNMSKKWNKWAENCIINPKIPLELSTKLARSKMANGGTDLSDGLSADLWSLCQASRVGANINTESIPISKNVKAIAIKSNIPAWFYAFTIGGDFQFIATAKRVHDKKMNMLGFKKIGEIIEGRSAFITYKNRKFPMPNIGHRDSRTSSSSFGSELGTLTETLIKNVLK